MKFILKTLTSSHKGLTVATTIVSSLFALKTTRFAYSAEISRIVSFAVSWWKFRNALQSPAWTIVSNSCQETLQMQFPKNYFKEAELTLSLDIVYLINVSCRIFRIYVLYSCMWISQALFVYIKLQFCEFHGNARMILELSANIAIMKMCKCTASLAYW